jgi:hypothetical protein
MPYIGNTPADKFLTLAKQSFSTSATTSYTLDSAVSSTQDIALFINNVRQSPVDAYTVSGTALTLTSATAGTDEMYCVYLGKTVGTVSPASDSVTTAMIQSNAVNNAKMADDAIGLAELSATGTPSSSNFLRGDNSWATPSGGKIGAVTISPNITTGQTSTTSTSYVDSGTTVISLTPSATSSKIWVSYTFNFDAGADGQGVSSAIYADINGAGYNNIDSTGQFADYNDLGNGTRLRQWVTLNSLYSPSTTSIVNFKLYWKTSAGTAYLNLKTVKIVLLEVLA